MAVGRLVPNLLAVDLSFVALAYTAGLGTGQIHIARLGGTEFGNCYLAEDVKAHEVADNQL